VSFVGGKKNTKTLVTNNKMEFLWWVLAMNVVLFAAVLECRRDVRRLAELNRCVDAVTKDWVAEEKKKIRSNGVGVAFTIAFGVSMNVGLLWVYITG
jgi:hypothetical protein